MGFAEDYQSLLSGVRMVPARMNQIGVPLPYAELRGGGIVPNQAGRTSIMWAQWRTRDGELYTSSLRGNPVGLHNMVRGILAAGARLIQTPAPQLQQMFAPLAPYFQAIAAGDENPEDMATERRLVYQFPTAVYRDGNGRWTACVSLPTRFGSSLSFCATADEAMVRRVLGALRGGRAAPDAISGVSLGRAFRRIGKGMMSFAKSPALQNTLGTLGKIPLIGTPFMATQATINAATKVIDAARSSASKRQRIAVLKENARRGDVRAEKAMGALRTAHALRSPSPLSMLPGPLAFGMFSNLLGGGMMPGMGGGAESGWAMYDNNDGDIVESGWLYHRNYRPSTQARTQRDTYLDGLARAQAGIPAVAISTLLPTVVR